MAAVGFGRLAELPFTLGKCLLPLFLLAPLPHRVTVASGGFDLLGDVDHAEIGLGAAEYIGVPVVLGLVCRALGVEPGGGLRSFLIHYARTRMSHYGTFLWTFFILTHINFP